MRIKLTDPSLLDISLPSIYNSLIIGPNSPAAPIIDINYISYSSAPKENIPQTKFQLRITDIKLTLLNRVLMEIIDYYYKGLYGLFANDNAQKSVGAPTDVAILVLNSTIFLPRNSISKEGLISRFTTLSFGNNQHSELITSHKFNHESDLDHRLQSEKDEDSTPISNGDKIRLVKLNASGMIQQRLRENSSPGYRRDSITKAYHKTLKIEGNLPEKIKPIVIDSFEIYFYDPDASILEDQDKDSSPKHFNPSEDEKEDEEKEDEKEEKQLKIMLKARNIPAPLESIIDDSGMNLSSEEDLLPKRDFLNPFSRVANSFYRIRAKSSLSEEGEDKSQVKLEESKDYILRVLEFEIIDSENLKITTNSIDFDLNLHFSETRPGMMEISLNFTYQSITLDLFRDQYNLLIKIFTENFFELPNYPPSKPQENDDI